MRQRAPSTPLGAVAEGVRAQRVPGAGRVFGASPVPAQQMAAALAVAGVASSDTSPRGSKVDIFTLTSNGAQDLSLTYLPIEDSWNLLHNRLGCVEGEHFTISGQTVSLLSGTDPLTGDTVRVQYDYLSGQSVPAADLGGDYDTQVLADSPIAYWKMDGSGSTELDVTGNGHTATAVGTGVVRQTASLMPTDPDLSTTFQYLSGAGNGHFTVPDHSAFDTPDFTLEFWTDRGASGGAYFYHHPGRFQLLLQGGKGRLLYWNGTAWVTLAETTGVGYTSATSFRYYAITYNGAAVNFYHDGTLYQTVPTSTVLSAGTGDIIVGPFTGIGTVEDDRLQKFAVYGTALSAARIADHYAVA